MSGETPKSVDLTTYHAICEKKFDEIDEDVKSVRKLLWGLLASIVLVFITLSISTVATYAHRQNRLDEIKAVVEEVVNGK